jgi:hypothetical protein
MSPSFLDRIRLKVVIVNAYKSKKPFGFLVLEFHYFLANPNVPKTPPTALSK